MAVNASSGAVFDVPLAALGTALLPLVPALISEGTQAFRAHKSPYKYATLTRPALTYILPDEWSEKIYEYDIPENWRRSYSAGVQKAIDFVAACLAPPLLGLATRQWLAGGLVYTYAMKVLFMAVFFPQFIFYRAADKYGFLDRWKTNPYRENPDKATEEKIWNGLWPSVLYSFPTEGLMLWAINYGRGEICYTCLPPLADIVIKVLITMWIADTTYFFLHWYEHQPGIYAKVHKAHHNIRWLNVYAFFYQTKFERYLLRLNSFVGNMFLAYTFGNDFMSDMIGAAFFISFDIHIHTGYTVPFHPFNWFNPQYFVSKKNRRKSRACEAGGGDGRIGTEVLTPLFIPSTRHAALLAPQTRFARLRRSFKHDFHHSQNAGNYSAFFSVPPFSWDYWMGTDKNYRQWRKKGGPVRLHRNTWPGFAVEGDLALAKKMADERAAKEAMNDDAEVIDGRGKTE